jgi:nucleotide-binding universal stress UspA family protein
MEKISHILVPINGDRCDDEALQLASLIAKKNKSHVTVMHVVEVPRALPLDAELTTETTRGERLLERAEEQAHHFGLEIHAELLQARVAGVALVDEAARLQVDLIILGLPNRTRFGTFYLSKNSNYILNHATCRVWLAREPAGHKTESHP